MTKLFIVSIPAIPTAFASRDESTPLTGKPAAPGTRARRLLAKPLQQAASAPTLPGIQLQILFDAGRDELTERGRASLLLLVDLLRAYPQLLVRLEGHTDPRGTDEYNNVLSDYRARSVEDCLTGAGIELARIERSACGASRSRAARGDSRGYALERRVTLEVYRASEPAIPLH